MRISDWSSDVCSSDLAVCTGDARECTGRQRSAQAAGQIKQLISRSTAQVQSGTELVGKAGAAVDGIVAMAAKVRAHIGEISHAAGEQASGVGQKIGRAHV